MLRTKLPDTRPSVVHKFTIRDTSGFIIVGLYENGQPGEIFINVTKEGSTLGGAMDSFAAAVSIGLQYGVPLNSLVKKFKGQRFEPSGHTKNPSIPYADSVTDYVFRWLESNFLNKETNEENSCANQAEVSTTQGH